MDTFSIEIQPTCVSIGRKQPVRVRKRFRKGRAMVWTFKIDLLRAGAERVINRQRNIEDYLEDIDALAQEVVDTWAEWDVVNQRWEIAETFEGMAYCNSCDDECTVTFEPER